MTARSFADAFNRVANPRLESPATAYMREIVGAVAVMEGKAKAISGVRVLGRYRLQIRLTRPVGDFTARLTLPFFCPILPNSPVDPAGMNNPPGSGPYYVAERIVNRRIVLKRNPYYRGGRPANVDQVVWTIGESERPACSRPSRTGSTTASASSSASHDVSAARRAVRDQPAGRAVLRQPRLQTVYLAFNHDRPAFKGPGQIALKKAINYAIDRPALARAFGYLAGKRTDQILPPALGRDEQHLPARGSRPGDGAQVVRQGEAQAADARPLHADNHRSGSRSRRCSAST